MEILRDKKHKKQKSNWEENHKKQRGLWQTSIKRYRKKKRSEMCLVKEKEKAIAKNTRNFLSVEPCQ